MADDMAAGRTRMIAVVCINVVAFGVLMGLRGEFEQTWIKFLLGGCAFALLGIAMAVVQSYRRRRAATDAQKPG